MPSPMQITLNPDFTVCRDFCEQIETHFDAHQESIHKARNEIKKLPCEGQQVVVKSFKVPNFINRLVYTYFRTSKAQKSYDNALYLQSLNIHTPEPIAYIQELTPTLHKSFFLSQAFEYDFTIREPLLESSFTDRKSIFKAFATFTADLHKKGVLHLDYSPGNILVKRVDDGYLFSIVDINRMTFKTLTQKERFQNFSRLWADEDVLILIAKQYALDTGLEETLCQQQIIHFDKENKRIKNFKKKLRKKR